jgi:predicted DNA-binding transcriptional regulator AlpA
MIFFSSRDPGGFVRLRDILAPNGPVPVAKSTWWAGVKDGRFPQPVKISPRVTAWRVSDIEALMCRWASLGVDHVA